MVGFLVGMAVVAMMAAGIGMGINAYSDAQEIQELEADAQEQADLAEEKAAADLEAAVGQLGEGDESYDTYEDWYSAQVTEWEDAGSQGTLEDYIREQQMAELGKYGIARTELQDSYDFSVREYDAGVLESERNRRQENAMAMATGFRSGTPVDTVARNQATREAALTLYMDRVDAAYETGMARLDQGLADARTSYDLNIEQIQLDLSQYSDSLQREWDRTYNTGTHILNQISAGLSGAQAGFGVFQTGVNTGMWGFDDAGGFYVSPDFRSKPVPGIPDLRPTGVMGR